VLALLLFGETMTFVTLLGILVTAFGVSLVVRSPKINA
jgi:drug/metabolite transporter (DMT)-like permease